MIEAPLALAFAAGLVSTVNPCGFAMLPAYISYFVGFENEEYRLTAAATVARGLSIGAVVSGGFLLVFGVVGAIITLGLRSVIDFFPWAAIVIGVAIGILGIAMLAGYQPVINLPRFREGAGRSRRYSGVFVFGVAYAVASLSCTLPVFLAVVVGVVTSTNFLSGFVSFLVYGVGMSLVLLALTLALVFGKKSLVGVIRRSGRFLGRIAGAILVVAGTYITFFWIDNLSRPQAASSPIQFVDRLSATLTQVIGENPYVSGLILGAVVALAVAVLLLRRPRAQ